MIRRYLLYLTAVLLVCSNAYAENWYAINVYKVTDSKIGTFTIRVVKKVYDENTCYTVLNKPVDVSIGEMEWVDTMSATGVEYDDALGRVFNQITTEELYFYYIDAAGQETVIDFMGASQEMQESAGKLILKRFKNAGIKYISAISPWGDLEVEEVAEPESPKPEQINTGTERTGIALGASKADVTNLQGKPDRIVGETWFYGYDYVVFDNDGKVSEISNVLGALKVETEGKGT